MAEMNDVYSLSDDDLFGMLKDRGVDAGPILDSTRKVYQIKLQELLSREGGSDGVVIQQLEETYGDDEEVEEYDAANSDTQPIECDPIPVYTSYTPPRQPLRQDYGDELRSTLRNTPAGRYFAGEDVTLTRRTLRSSTTTTSTTNTGKSVPQTKVAKKKGGSWCYILLAVLVIGGLIFLVVQNMEAVASDPLKELEAGN